jgi:4-hydroxybenzoate polyprenyltransferase
MPRRAHRLSWGTSPAAQHWMIASSGTISFSSSVTAVACVVTLAVVVGFLLEEEVLVVAVVVLLLMLLLPLLQEVLMVAEMVLEMVVVVVVVLIVLVLVEEVLVRFGELLLEEVVGFGMGRSAAITSASMSSKSSSADRLPSFFFFGILSGQNKSGMAS